MPPIEDGVPPISIPDKQLALWEGRLLAYRGRAGAKRQFHVFIDEGDVPVTMTDRQFLDEQVAGRLRLVSAEEMARREHGLPAPTLELATPDDLKEVERRLRYVRAWERAGRPPRTEEGVGRVIADAAAARPVDPMPPSVRTFARWVSDWLLVGEKPEGLLPGRGGNREDRLCEPLHLVDDDEVHLVPLDGLTDADRLLGLGAEVRVGVTQRLQQLGDEAL